jgi:hypothetical protein
MSQHHIIQFQTDFIFSDIINQIPYHLLTCQQLTDITIGLKHFSYNIVRELKSGNVELKPRKVELSIQKHIKE